MHRIQFQATFQRNVILFALMNDHPQMVFIEVGIDTFYPDRVQVEVMGSQERKKMDSTKRHVVNGYLVPMRLLRIRLRREKNLGR